MRARAVVGRGVAGALAVALLATLVAAPGPAAAQKPVSIGTNPPGTVFYAIGSGLSKVVTDAGGAKMTVQPYTGSSTFLPLLDSGELEFGVVNAVDMALTYRGPAFKVGGKNPFPHGPRIRLVMRGAPFVVGPLVRKDSPIRTIHDARGKRVTGEYPAHLAAWYNMLGYLGSAGLGFQDVKVVPVPAINDGVDALVQGRADVAAFALNGAKVKEADVAVGVRHVSVDCSPEGEKRLRATVPGYYPRWVKKGEATGVVEDTCLVAYDLYLAAGRDVPDPVVEGVLRSLWEHVDRLKPIHPAFAEWTRERAASADVTLPYHPAAIRFYRERKVWTAEMDRAQQQLSALNPQ